MDRVPLPYYRAKHAAEQVVEGGPVPWTTFRTSQFHQLVAGMLAAQRRSPALLAPDVPLQPIDTRAVADRLADLALAAPAGRVPDVAGPEVRGLPALARAYRAHTRSRRPVVPVRLPGRTFAAYRRGAPARPRVPRRRAHVRGVPRGRRAGRGGLTAPAGTLPA